MGIPTTDSPSPSDRAPSEVIRPESTQPRSHGSLSARAVSAAIIALVALGSALRLYSYVDNRSLWLDEAALSYNILNRGFIELIAPLDRLQVAPLGFLWLERAAVSVFGTSEYALRLVPLLAGLAALLLFAHVARRMLSGMASVFALALFALAIPLIYYSVETKQYSLDVAVAIALFAVALHARGHELTPTRTAVLGLAGALAPWFSQPSVFAMGGVGLYLLLPLLYAPGSERRRELRTLGVIFALWAASGAAAILHSLTNIGDSDLADLGHFWESAFLPLSDGPVESARWLGGTTMEIFGWLIPGSATAIVLALFVLGAIVLVRRRDGTSTLLLAPLGFALLASALRLYPLTYRLALFVVPSLFLTAGAGAGWLLALLGSRASSAPARHGRTRLHPALLVRYVVGAGGVGAMAAVLVASTLALSELPFQREELRPVVSYLAQHRQPGDVIYVYYGAGQAFEYYAERAGIPRTAYQLGRCSRARWQDYLDDIDALRGKSRVWLVLAHPFLKGGIREDSLFVDYFAHVGRRIDATSAVGALAQLYDLSGAADGTTNAARSSFTVPTTSDFSAATRGCIGVVAD